MALLPDTISGQMGRGLSAGAQAGSAAIQGGLAMKEQQAKLEQQKRAQYIDQYKAQKDQSIKMVSTMKSQIDNDYLLKKRQVDSLKIEDPTKKTEMLNALEAKYRMNLSEWEKTRQGIYGSIQKSVLEPMVALGYLQPNQIELDQKQFMSTSPLRRDEQAYIEALTPTEKERQKLSTEQKAISFLNPDTQQIDFIQATDPNFAEKEAALKQRGFTRATQPTIDLKGETGLTTSQKGKVDLANIEAEQAIRKNVLNSENIINLVASDEFIGGVSGDAVSTINSFAAQTRQLMGVDSVMVNGKLDESKLDVSNKNMSRFRKAAIASDRTDAAILDLAYILAKTRDPAGRISDKDLDASEKTLRSGADKASIISLLRDNQNRAVQNYNSDIKVLNKRGFKYEPLSLEEILGGKPEGGRKSTKDMADEILKSEGLL